MHIAVPPTVNFVGRDAELAAVLAAMREPGARVVVSGVPGVGKDVLAAELARSRWARALGGVQFWVHGSTEATLRRSLLRLATDVLQLVREGEKAEAEEVLERLRAWLGAHAEWLLVVEDAGTELGVLRRVVLGAPRGHGRVLLTSQRPLPAAELLGEAAADDGGGGGDVHQVRLEPWGRATSYELWARMGVDEAELRAREARPGEAAPDDAARRALLDGFLDDELANLPLAVAMCGSLLRAGGRALTAAAFVREFRAAEDRG